MVPPKNGASISSTLNGNSSRQEFPRRMPVASGCQQARYRPGGEAADRAASRPCGRGHIAPTPERKRQAGARKGRTTARISTVTSQPV